MPDPVTQNIPAAAAMAAPSAPKPKNAAEAAKQFEALLIAQMLRNAREGSGSALGDEDDSTADTMWDVAAQQFSQVLATNGGLGLAKLITAGLKAPEK
jgi:Rod binding domain-containing protein